LEPLRREAREQRHLPEQRAPAILRLHRAASRAPAAHAATVARSSCHGVGQGTRRRGRPIVVPRHPTADTAATVARSRRAGALHRLRAMSAEPHPPASPAADPARAARCAFVPGAGTPPIPIARTEGSWLVLGDGRRVLDAAGGALVTNVGHGRREVVDAMARALARTDYVVPPFATDERVRLVERLVDRWLPAGLTRVTLTSGGSESVDAALRLARQHHVAAGRPTRWKVIGRELSYHGTTLATLAVGGHPKRRHGLEPLLGSWPKAPACDCLRCPLGLEPASRGLA